jgi:ABC-type Co2+ transport system permease subunit
MPSVNDYLKLAIKYLIEGLVVATVAYIIPKRSMDLEEIAVIALMAAATFAILDVFIPAAAGSSRQGIGFAVGSALGGGVGIKNM